MAGAAIVTPQSVPGSGSDTERLCPAVTFLSATKLRRCSTSFCVDAYFAALGTHDYQLVYACFEIH